MAERDAGKPVDADMDICLRLLPSGNVEVASARRARADEHGVIAFCKYGLEAVDAATANEANAEIEDIAALLVDHRVRQTELWDLRAHHAARLRILIEHRAVIAE